MNTDNIAEEALPDAESTANESVAVPETEPQPEPEPERLQFTLEEWEAEIAQAEQRGYTRGRNEKIETLNARPEIFENTTVEMLDQRLQLDSSFLCSVRPSIWDK